MSRYTGWCEPGQLDDWRFPRAFSEALEAFVSEPADLKYGLCNLDRIQPELEPWPHAPK